MKTLEQILVSGSDARLIIDAATGLNRFGCAPTPRPDALRFGSSTASSISPEAFRRVQCDYESFCRVPCPERHLDARMEALRCEIRDLLGLAGTGTEIVFSPSGTDSTLHALALVRALTGGAPLDCLLPASDETGSGVPLALSGRHFSGCTSEGVSVTQGEAIAGLDDGMTLVSLPRRSADGVVRPPACQDQDIWDAVERSAEAGRPVLLQVMDSSKLGSASPSAECLRRIQARFAGSVHVVVDACQMRLSRERLQSHLDSGHLVLVSGSKFFTGPPFSGALLVPAALAARLKMLPSVAPGLRDYTSRCDWPQAWTALRASLPDRANFGQYFRWLAALTEMRAYFSVPPEFRDRVLRVFADRTAARIQSYASDLRLLETHCSEREPQTIFPFLVRQGSRWMTVPESTGLYRSLNQNMAETLPASLTASQRTLAATRCHVGQPVRVSTNRGEEAGALRICADARMVTQVWAESQANPGIEALAHVEQQVCTVLAKTALIARLNAEPCPALPPQDWNCL